MSTLMTAISGRRPTQLPVWFMRQAGRSLPEYRRARRGVDMLEACLKPDLAAEITLQPVRRHQVDAAIFFSDIVIPLKLAGVPVDIHRNVGPVFDRAYSDRASVHELAKHQITDDTAIREAVALCVAELGQTPLLGFAGAPFTLAAYLVEGRPSRDHLAARALMHTDPDTWDVLLSWCAQISAQFLQAQCAAGAAAVQLFDSWAGSLGRADYVRFVRPYSERVLAAVTVPTIHFGTNTAHLLSDFARADVMGIDYRIPLDDAVQVLGPETVVQGNINPALLDAPWPVLDAHIREVVQAGQSARAHIVNLGHGVPPHTDPKVLTAIVELVHSL